MVGSLSRDDLYRSTEIKRLDKECDRDLDSEGDSKSCSLFTRLIPPYNIIQSLEKLYLFSI